jgi:antitoxin component YwqK of YwqJK toxin-antitoxin module
MRNYCIGENIEGGSFRNTNEEINGIHSIYTKKGFLKSIGEYTKGKKDGFFNVYHINGQIKIKCSYTTKYSASERHGKWIEYYDNGELKVVGRYKFGSKHGAWVYYDTKGMTIQVMFNDGKLLLNSTFY